MSETVLKSSEIECDGCARAIQNAVGKLPGVQSVEVDIAEKKVTVRHEETTVPSAITAAMEKAGFPVDSGVASVSRS